MKKKLPERNCFFLFFDVEATKKTKILIEKLEFYLSLILVNFVK